MNIDKLYAESIAKEYAPKESSKVVALKKLDRKAKMPAIVFMYIFGTVSALVFGVGMCLAMQVMAGTTFSTWVGIIIGILGIVGISVNYLICKRALEKGKQKYAFEIVELAR